MAKIEVNHQAIRDFASEIAAYCDEQDRQMRAADSQMSTLFSTGYKGLDASALREKWDMAHAPDSTASRFRDSLKNYASALTDAAEIYRSAQEAIYNAANRLPKYLYW
ncbi:MAG: hypothetical protein IKR84_03345 [Oscillibacter sp.]|nr:hypothetical protein [Oscillibacter sp.]